MSDFQLSHDQVSALERMIDFYANEDERLLALSGPAGTGKTTVVGELLDRIGSEGGESAVEDEDDFLSTDSYRPSLSTATGRAVYLCATTHKAAMVMTAMLERRAAAASEAAVAVTLAENSEDDDDEEDFVQWLPVPASVQESPKARTVHSLLGLQPKDDFNTGKTTLVSRSAPKLTAHSLVIVDESSMIGRDLFERIRVIAEEYDAKFLFIGDPYQLAPVGEDTKGKPGRPPIFDLVPTISLTEIHRQGPKSPIIDLAAGIRAVQDGGEYPLLCPDGRAIRHFGPKDKVEFKGLISDLFDSPEYADDPDYCRLVAFTNEQVRKTNRYVRGLVLGEEAAREPFVVGERLAANSAVSRWDPYSREEVVVLPNEAVVEVEQIRAEPITPRLILSENNIPLGGYASETLTSVLGAPIKGHHLTVRPYDGESKAQSLTVFVPSNTERGAALLKAISQTALAMKQVRGIQRSEISAVWRLYFGLKSRLVDLRPPHALTVHKAQGSTYRHVLIFVDDLRRALGRPGHLYSRLLYVAVTRAAETVAIYGDLQPGTLGLRLG